MTVIHGSWEHCHPTLAPAHLYMPELRSLTMILKLGGKVKRADSMARMDMNIISKKSSPLVLRASWTRSDCPFCSQNSPAHTTARQGTEADMITRFSADSVSVCTATECVTAKSCRTHAQVCCMQVSRQACVQEQQQASPDRMPTTRNWMMSCLPRASKRRVLSMRMNRMRSCVG